MSEEEKAIKRLEEMTINYKLNSEDLHYAIILFNYIKNLQKENEQLKDDLNKLKVVLKEEKAKLVKSLIPINNIALDIKYIIKELEKGDCNDSKENN